MKTIKISLSLILFFFIFTSVLAMSTEKELQEKENQLAYVRSQIHKGQYLIEETNKETEKIILEIDNINKLIESTQSDIDKILSIIQEKEQKLNEISSIKETTNENFSSITKNFEDTMYSITGGESFVSWTKNTKSPTTLMLRLKQVSIIYDIFNMALNNSLEVNINVTAQEGTLNYEKQQLEHQRSMYTQKQKYIKTLYDEKVRIYYELTGKINEYAQELDSLEISSLQLTDVIKELQSYGYKNNGVVVSNGLMIWPAKKGVLTSEFGYRIHPIHKVKKLHKGIDIGLPEGEPVIAAFSGIVITSGWLSGYGNTVIIDHGNGISTLYAHNSKLNVSVGDEVITGQLIAKVGSTGLSTGPHIHFEVRVNGEATDPTDWLKVVYK